MSDIVLFGGTTEGRTIAALLEKQKRQTLLCVATKYGEDLAPQSDWINVHTGRLDQEGMCALFQTETPQLVIDSTHPYATLVSQNIRSACDACGVQYIRVNREALTDTGEGVFDFFDISSLVAWINTQTGTVFSTLGTKDARSLAEIVDFKERVILRILPDVTGLQACLDIGFLAKNIICMQGPFSKAMNQAMFSDTDASILVTKESGKAGGFAEKISVAQDCKMKIAILRRPPDQSGIPLARLLAQIKEGQI